MDVGKRETETIEKFRKELEQNPDIKADAKAELLAAQPHELIHEAFSRSHENYRAAVLAADPAAWQKVLAGSPNKFLEAEARYRLARAYLLRDEYEKAAEELEALEEHLGEWTTRLPESRIFLAYSYGKLEDLGRARRILDDMLQNQPKAPERIREMAQWFLRELKGQGTGPLLELSKSMDAIRRHINRGETGNNPTQERQRDVVKELERLIKLLEDQDKSGGGCKKCEGKGCKSCEKSGQGKPGNNPSSPLEKSMLPGGDPKGGALGQDPKRGASEFWGGLRDLERGQVLQILKERFPSQYKELIEQYYRSLNEGEGVANPTTPKKDE